MYVLIFIKCYPGVCSKDRLETTFRVASTNKGSFLQFNTNEGDGPCLPGTRKSCCHRLPCGRRVRQASASFGWKAWRVLANPLYHEQLLRLFRCILLYPQAFSSSEALKTWKTQEGSARQLHGDWHSRFPAWHAVLSDNRGGASYRS